MLTHPKGRTMATLFRRILVPHDFSSNATAALKIAAGLAAPRGGRLVVLHALAPVYTGSWVANGGELPAWVPPQELVAETRQRLEALVARTVKGRRGAVTCRVLIGDPYHCIVEAARQSDSIVMATLGRTGLSHLLLGSVAEKVVRHAPVPVLTVRAKVARRVSTARGAASARRGRTRGAA
jgi:nucleotide-binding universal stress UspA family protein